MPRKSCIDALGALDHIISRMGGPPRIHILGPPYDVIGRQNQQNHMPDTHMLMPNTHILLRIKELAVRIRLEIQERQGDS